MSSAEDSPAGQAGGPIRTIASEHYDGLAMYDKRALEDGDCWIECQNPWEVER